MSAVGDDLGRQADQGDMASVGVLYALPPEVPEFPTARRFGKAGPAQDAVQTLRALKFWQHLRALKKSDIAVRACIDMTCGSTELADQVLEHMPENPSSSSLNEARIKLDSVTMQIERRQLQDRLKNKRETL